LNKLLGGTFYVAWFFVWITILYPETTTRINALGLTGTPSLFVNALVFILLIMGLAVPAYYIGVKD